MFVRFMLSLSTLLKFSLPSDLVNSGIGILEVSSWSSGANKRVVWYLRRDQNVPSEPTRLYRDVMKIGLETKVIWSRLPHCHLVLEEFAILCIFSDFFWVVDLWTGVSGRKLVSKIIIFINGDLNTPGFVITWAKDPRQRESIIKSWILQN